MALSLLLLLFLTFADLAQCQGCRDVTLSHCQWDPQLVLGSEWVEGVGMEGALNCQKRCREIVDGKVPK